jgi:uncharacterized protein YndB with AHSA1/START domain
MTRVFRAPRALVFDALTRPELLKRWYGPPGWSLVVCEIDLRVGGAWRFVTRRPNGKELGQRGVYREIVPPERLVNTESWDDWNPGELLITTLLVEQAGTTAFTSTLRFPSREVRDTLEKGAHDERNFVKKGVSWALRSIGRRNGMLHAGASAVARRLARSEEAAGRWVGKEALRELGSAKVRARLESRKA